MLTYRHIIRPTAQAISQAVNTAIDAYRKDRVTDEPNITDRMLGAIEQQFSRRSINGVRWTAKTLRATKGSGAEEKQYGADFLGVLEVELSDYRIKKGFLAQAKRAEPREWFPRAEWQRLKGQAEKMLARTSDAFIFVYSRKKGVRIVPASAVVSARTNTLFEIYNHSIGRFFEDHLKSFVGDLRLNSPDIETLAALDDFSVRKVLHLYGREALLIEREG